jgi:hypothetical protein
VPFSASTKIAYRLPDLLSGILTCQASLTSALPIGKSISFAVGSNSNCSPLLKVVARSELDKRAVANIDGSKVIPTFDAESLSASYAEIKGVERPFFSTRFD